MSHLRLVPDLPPDPLACPLDPAYPKECLHDDGEACLFRAICETTRAKIERERAER